MISNARILGMLAELARLTALDEGTPQSFKVRAYENAIHGIEGYAGNVATLDQAELDKIKGVGGSIAAHIREFVDTGAVSKLEKLRDKYPAPLVELLKIPGVGPKTLKTLRAELGIENLADLRAAIDRQALREVPGMGKVTEEKIARAIERLGLHGKDRRTPIADALPLAEGLATELRGIDGVVSVEGCGSLRRFAETVGDVDLVVAATEPAAVMAAVAHHPLAVEVVGSGETKTTILTRAGLQIDVRVVAPDQLGAALMYFTGSKSHNVALRQRAIDRGWLLNEYGLFEGETCIASATEEEVYAALDLPFLPPPIRENSGEIEAAAAGSLPDLVTHDRIRGDLHVHSDRSGDGRSTLQEMVQALAPLGYEYVAITEHGEDLAINGSTRQEMRAHRRKIERIQQRYPKMRLLYGCELNIGPDGGLDYDAEFRLSFEWCVASIHSYFDLTAEQQTARLLRAMADPAVNAIGHITGRYLGRRPGIELDVAAVLEGMALSGVALEVNGALDRLDASADVIRMAVAAGVSLAIATDSHHTSDLKRMAYGVAHSQRGWAASSDVANTMSLSGFLEFAGRRR